MSGAHGLLEIAFAERAALGHFAGDHVSNLVETALPIHDAILARSTQSKGTTVAGLCGSQGSGKTTIADGIAHALRLGGRSVVSLSIDDVYLSRRQREQLASDVHPLLITRGVPGTHDVDRATAVLDALASQGPPVALPAFDKANDDRVPASQEASAPTPVDIVLLEGWCVGARPQASGALAAPANSLECDEDADGSWRRYVNEQLSGPYRAFFARIDVLALLQAPGFEQVYAWRLEQEHKLAASLTAQGRPIEGSRVMDEEQIRRFISHYERLTRHILEEMPGRADIVIPLDAARRPARN
ncbi:hypothetical protein [Novosphingobium sp. AP12]|uniref:hypothetical protein n=1 Tax=Novosphingobium sp. AP12 TaxID=1144305 RepID=UPI0002720011|nr:hypothetical protein [Novosphingobium sp. AP12]EJL30849.1 putative kinase [Novosphingobium sp. AP12]